MLNSLLDLAMPTTPETPLGYFFDDGTLYTMFIIGMIALVAVITLFSVLTVKRKRNKKKDENTQQSITDNEEEEK